MYRYSWVCGWLAVNVIFLHAIAENLACKCTLSGEWCMYIVHLNKSIVGQYTSINVIISHPFLSDADSQTSSAQQTICCTDEISVSLSSWSWRGVTPTHSQTLISVLERIAKLSACCCLITMLQIPTDKLFRCLRILSRIFILFRNTCKTDDDQRTFLSRSSRVSELNDSTGL